MLQLCSRLTDRPFREAIPGSSFFTSYYEYHRDDPDCRIFLLGAAEGVAQEAMRRINARMKRNIVVGALSPSYGLKTMRKRTAT